MIIDHRERTILVAEDELKFEDVGCIVDNIDQSKTVFYTLIDYSGKNIKPGQSVYSSESSDEAESEEIPELVITLKSMTPAYNYLGRFDIHDYKVILEDKNDNS